MIKLAFTLFTFVPISLIAFTEAFLVIPFAADAIKRVFAFALLRS